MLVNCLVPLEPPYTVHRFDHRFTQFKSSLIVNRFLAVDRIGKSIDRLSDWLGLIFKTMVLVLDIFSFISLIFFFKPNYFEYNLVNYPY